VTADKLLCLRLSYRWGRKHYVFELSVHLCVRASGQRYSRPACHWLLILNFCKPYGISISMYQHITQLCDEFIRVTSFVQYSSPMASKTMLMCTGNFNFTRDHLKWLCHGMLRAHRRQSPVVLYLLLRLWRCFVISEWKLCDSICLSYFICSTHWYDIMVSLIQVDENRGTSFPDLIPGLRPWPPLEDLPIPWH